MKNKIFPHTFWGPFLDCMPQLFFRPKYMWFPVHLKGPMIPDPSGQLAELIVIPPATKLRGVYWIHPVRLSVCLSVCPSVRPSVRPWVGVRMITLILFSGFKNFFFTYITWVKILHGMEYQRPTSLNMRILADHVTYSFLAFPKSIF